jgi:transcriptional regulator with XRE-family HTH domain
MMSGWRVLGHAVRDRRLDLGLSQEALAEAAGVSDQTVRRIEHGREAGFRSGTLRQIEKGLGWKPGTARQIAESNAAKDSADWLADDAEVRAGAGVVRADYALDSSSLEHIIARLYSDRDPVLYVTGHGAPIGEGANASFRLADELLTPIDLFGSGETWRQKLVVLNACASGVPIDLSSRVGLPNTKLRVFPPPDPETVALFTEFNRHANEVRSRPWFRDDMSIVEAMARYREEEGDLYRGVDSHSNSDPSPRDESTREATMEDKNADVIQGPWIVATSRNADIESVDDMHLVGELVSRLSRPGRGQVEREALHALLPLLQQLNERDHGDRPAQRELLEPTPRIRTSSSTGTLPRSQG